MKQPLSRRELEGLHSVLRRAIERAEARKAAGDPSADAEADVLAKEVAAIAVELSRAG